MQSEMNAMLLAGSAHRPGARIVETGQRVFRGVELDVDAAHIMARRPFDGVLELEATADIDADAVAQAHGVRSLPLRNGGQPRGNHRIYGAAPCAGRRR